MNSKNTFPFMCGVKLGEHSKDVESLTREIKERVIDMGCNFVYIRTKFGEKLPPEVFYKWSKILSDNKIYFHFGSHRPPNMSIGLFDEQTVEKMKEIAGEYFLGDAISEPGTAAACNFTGYYPPAGHLQNKPYTECADMKEAHDRYVNTVKSYVELNRKINIPNIINVEATALPKYNLEAGIDIPVLELMNGNPDELIPFSRGAARAYNCNIWGALIAHEWYGGIRHTDILKRKRLQLAYKYAYLSGADIILMESGDEKIKSYGEEYDYDSELCQEYRKVLKDTCDYASSDNRPRGGPTTEFAFVSGRYDAWSGFCGSSLWDQYERKEWGHGEAEYSWKIINELGVRRKWADVANYGDNDTSAFPAYGTYDVVPIEADIDSLSKYKYLVFMGWNTMTNEDANKLAEYVRRGGNLLMSMAHLNQNTKRNSDYLPIDNDIMEELCGVRFTGEVVSTNSGTKFVRNSLNKDILYPGSDSTWCDPLFSAGFADYAKVELCGAKSVGTLSDSFWGMGNCDICSVVEHAIGKGVVTLVTSINYPGNMALYPLYSALVKEFVSSSSRNCKIKVIGSDRVRYAVYGDEKIYLLNTDYDMPITVKVINGEKESIVTLESLELKSIQL